MTLTKQEAIENHRKMWNWIADELENTSTNKYLMSYDIQEKYFAVHKIKESDRPDCLNYCCEYAKQQDPEVKNLEHRCDFCPIRYGNSFCLDVDMPLDDFDWEMSLALGFFDSYTKAAKIARQIANLPERKDV